MLVKTIAWHRQGDKPLSEPMMDSLLTHICVIRPQWVKMSSTGCQTSYSGFNVFGMLPTHCHRNVTFWTLFRKELRNNPQIHPSSSSYLPRDRLNHDDVIKWKHFRVTGLLRGKINGHRWIPRTKTGDTELTKSWVKTGDADDSRRHISLIMTAL